MDDDPQKIYIPGDTVAGKVVLDVPRKLKRESLMLSFIGESRYTYVTSNGPYSGVTTHGVYIPIFKVNQILHPGPVTLAREKHEWSFDFTFPEYFTPFYAHDSVQPLPPSTHDLAEINGGSPAFGIVYYIQAWCGKRWGQRYRPHDFRNLRFRHPSKQPHDAPETQAIALKARHWSADRLPSKIHALGERITGVLPNAESHTPCVRFIPTIHLPKAIAPDQVMPLSLAVKMIESKHVEHGQREPSLVLESVSVRVLDTQKHRGWRKTGDRFFHGEAFQIQLPLENTPVSLVGSFTLEDGGEVEPGFQFPIGSHNFVRDHFLTVILRVRYLDKAFTIKSPKILLVVRPKYDPRMAQIPSSLLPAPPENTAYPDSRVLPRDVLKARTKERRAARKARWQGRV